MKKYIVYIILAALMICGLFYMRDGISLWLSTIGTYVVISVVTFFLGWLLGYWATRNRYKRRIKELQAEHKTAIEKQRAEFAKCTSPSKPNAESNSSSLLNVAEQAALQK